MPARTVFFAPDCYYHVYNRGSEKRTIYLHPRDYNKFISRTKEYSQKYEIDVLSYCLMPNHFHFLLRQKGEISINAFMYVLQLSYAKYFNTKNNRVGPLFQGRFKAKLIETEEYLLQVSAYIHRNPIAHLFDSRNREDFRKLALSMLESYPYFSYSEYVHPYSQSFINTNIILSYFSKTNPKLSYKSFVENFTPDIEALYPILAHE